MLQYLVGVFIGVITTRTYLIFEKNRKLRYKYECPIDGCAFRVRTNKIRIIDHESASHAQWHLNEVESVDEQKRR